jgi:hypothetical protein
MQWFFAAVLVVVLGALFWDVFTRGKHGTRLALGVAAGLAAIVAGIMRGADVERPWPLVALVASVALTALASRTNPPQRTN